MLKMLQKCTGGQHGCSKCYNHAVGECWGAVQVHAEVDVTTRCLVRVKAKDAFAGGGGG